jgi:hypothetical protein
MTSQRGGFNRALTGVLAVGCGIAGIALCVVRGTEDALGASLIRAGVVLGALWIALPTRSREAAWARVSPYAVIGIAIGIVLLVRHVRVLLPVAIAAAAAGYLLRPRKSRSRPR